MYNNPVRDTGASTSISPDAGLDGVGVVDREAGCGVVLSELLPVGDEEEPSSLISVNYVCGNVQPSIIH